MQSNSLILSGTLLCALASNVPAADGSLRFGKDILPIVADKCFTCHGPDDAQRQGQLRLDQRDSAFGKGESGETAIVPGHPEQSEVIRRITSTDESMRMPPADAEKQLTAEEIEKIRQWIDQGATWQKHWAFQPVEKPAVPVHESSWGTNEIDAFALQKLNSEGMSPTQMADRETLLRRVTFDLTGLPPTIAEMDEFLGDSSPMAYEKVVDRLLASERYGEHMARFWLDAARYGDTHGLHLDNYREMWPYRDWVVRSFNSNMPYDRFIIEQLAGDLLPEPTLDQLIATGFNRCHVTTNEGGSIREEVHVRNVVDRVDTTATVFMGLTFECTRCHDHKYDPFTMNDFYSMYAYFNSIDGDPLDGNRKDPAPVIRAPTADQAEQLKTFGEQIAAVEQQLKAAWPEVDSAQAAWEQTLAANSEEVPEKVTLALGDWYTVGPFNETRRYQLSKKHGPEGKPVKLDEKFMLATGESIEWKARPEWVDAKVHSDLPGDEAINYLYRKITTPDARSITISLGSDDGIKVFLNQKEIFKKDVARGAAPDQDKVELKLAAGENELVLKIMNYGGASGFYFRVDGDTAIIPEDILAVAQTPSQDRSPEQQARLMEFFRFKIAAIPELVAVKNQLSELRKQRDEIDRLVPTTLIWKEKKEPEKAFLLKRGEYDQPGSERPRQTPLTLPPMKPEWPNDRLGLAYWLVDPSHPLTARVAVNRLWQQFLGTGIVKTADDFGTRSEHPSHPELLDWLAAQFRDDGWDVKRFVKRIVMSSTYRQSSGVTPELYTQDPENRLLARGPRFRLDAEMLRDQALFVSGLLIEELGGPSVKPPQPDLWFDVGYSGSNTVRFTADSGAEKVHRRTLYTFVKRTSPPPQMSTFDGPSREACSVRRERTNTPLQALLLMNDPQYVEAARALSQRVLKEGGADDEQRARFLLRMTTGRQPSSDEVSVLVEGVKDDHEAFSRNPEEARKLLGIGEAAVDAQLDQVQLAAWTLTANLVLNLDEVVTKN